MGASGAFVGIDFGAESLRAYAGRLSGGVLRIEEISRAANAPFEEGGRLYWDLDHLRSFMISALSEAGTRHRPVRSVGIDTWGVDFGLFDHRGNLVKAPFSYRDPRNLEAMRNFLRRFPARKLYELTGIQIKHFNSVFQLFACRMEEPDILERASRILFMPDIFNRALCGVAVTEFTFATTTQLYNPVKGAWEDEILRALGLPADMMSGIVSPGTVLGPILPDIGRITDTAGAKVVAVGSHDTASAVAAVPAEGDDWGFVSSGTWSLVGTEIERPLINELSFSHNFTNEGGVGGRFRFLKNVSGLWLLRRCREEWAGSGESGDYAELVRMASASPAFKAVIDPDDESFVNPPSMTGAIKGYCERTGQEAPSSPGEYTRVILESLALATAHVVHELEDILPSKIKRIHIVGGGARNELLNQFTADAVGMEVLAGPYEATVTGNLMVQALAAGAVSGLEELRRVVRSSFPVKRFLPRPGTGWDKAFDTFRKLKETGPESGAA